MCEIIEFEGKKLKAVPTDGVASCKECFFLDSHARCRPCCPEEREDSQYVIFVEVIDA